MLQQLLNEIRAGGTLEVGILATRLGTTPQMVATMLEHLERLGVLQNLRRCNPSNCSGCTLAEACSPAGELGARVWWLEENPNI